MIESIGIYNILLSKNFSKEEAETVINEIEATVDRNFNKNNRVLSTKSDLNTLEMSLSEKIHKSTLSLKDDINRMIVWVIGLILGQTGLIFLILQLVGVFEN